MKKNKQKNFKKNNSKKDNFRIKNKKNTKIFLEADNVIITKKGIYTKNATPGFKVYDEENKFFDNKEYRFWNPFKSKISAALMKGLKLNFKNFNNILYLGAASGTTVSHISDIIFNDKNKKIFAVEFSRETYIDLFFLSKKRNNIIPFFEDAFKTKNYFKYIPKIDFLFMDIAQKNQVEILKKNTVFLNENSIILFALKAKSVDVSKSNKQIYIEVKKSLEETFIILQELNLEPYEKDHKIYLLKLKS